jgi:hypothetical protein
MDLKEYDVRMWTVSSYRNLWLSGCLLWTRCWNIGFHDTWRIALSLSLLWASEQETCSMELLTSAVFCARDLIDSEAVSSLLPSNSNRSSHCEGHGSALRNDHWPIRFTSHMSLDPSQYYSVLHDVLSCFEQWVLFRLFINQHPPVRSLWSTPQVCRKPDSESSRISGC